MTAPGWYPDEQGNTRYWNGSGWADHAPTETSILPPPPVNPAGHRTTTRTPWYQKPAVYLTAAALGLLAVGSALGSTVNAKTKRVAGPTVRITETATVTVEVTPTPTFTTPNNLPAPSDFKIGVKIKSQHCFGSAGCNITFQVVPQYVGSQDISSLSLSVTYAVSGVQNGPQIDTFTLRSGAATVKSEESAQTSSESDTLTARATSVDPG